MRQVRRVTGVLLALAAVVGAVPGPAWGSAQTESDLKISRFALAGRVGPNPRFQVTVGNDGPVSSPGGTLSISGLGGAPTGDTETSCDRTANGLVCKLLAIEVGGSLVYDFGLKGNSWRDLTITVTATGSNPDPRSGNNSARLGPPWKSAGTAPVAATGTAPPGPTPEPSMFTPAADDTPVADVQIRAATKAAESRGFPWLLVLMVAIVLATAGWVILRWKRGDTGNGGQHRITR